MKVKLLKKIRKRFEILTYHTEWDNIKVADHKNKEIIYEMSIANFITSVLSEFDWMYSSIDYEDRHRKRRNKYNYNKALKDENEQ